MYVTLYYFIMCSLKVTGILFNCQGLRNLPNKSNVNMLRSKNEVDYLLFTGHTFYK